LTTPPPRAAALASAALCSLPANDPLCASILRAHAHDGTVAEALSAGLHLPAGHSAPEAPAFPEDSLDMGARDAAVAPSGSDAAGLRLLQGRLQALAALQETLRAARGGRAGAAAKRPCTSSEDDFSVFD
jgi:hypothetical protein